MFKDLLPLKQKYQAQGEYYKKTLDMIEGHLKLNNEIEVSTNPAWFSLKSQKYHQNSEQQNYKIYKTIAPNNYEYIAKIIPLAQEFEKLAQNTQDDISLKIPGGFLGFLSHSDSLVVHFKKRENKDIIDKIIEKWLSSHFLSSQKREYKRTEFAKDTLERSFSEDISKKITNWIETYQGNYDNKILAKYGLQWALYLSQQSWDEGENKKF